MNILLKRLKSYIPKNKDKIKERKQTISVEEGLKNNRQVVIDAFQEGISPYIDGFQISEESEEKPEEG